MRNACRTDIYDEVNNSYLDYNTACQIILPEFSWVWLSLLSNLVCNAECIIFIFDTKTSMNIVYMPTFPHCRTDFARQDVIHQMQGTLWSIYQILYYETLRVFFAIIFSCRSVRRLITCNRNRYGRRIDGDLMTDIEGHDGETNDPRSDPPSHTITDRRQRYRR